jgi:membrane associated rhomboid family serine protease
MSEDTVQALSADALIGWAVTETSTALTQVGALADRSDMAFAVVLGALTVALNARIALLAPLMVLATATAQKYGFEVDQALIEAVPFIALAFLILGAVQSVVGAIAGRDAAATLIGVIIGGLFLFTLWRGPTRILRMLSRGRF